MLFLVQRIGDIWHDLGAYFAAKLFWLVQILPTIWVSIGSNWGPVFWWHLDMLPSQLTVSDGEEYFEVCSSGQGCQLIWHGWCIFVVNSRMRVCGRRSIIPKQMSIVGKRGLPLHVSCSNRPWLSSPFWHLICPTYPDIGKRRDCPDVLWHTETSTWSYLMLFFAVFHGSSHGVVVWEYHIDVQRSQWYQICSLHIPLPWFHLVCHEKLPHFWRQ